MNKSSYSFMVASSFHWISNIRSGFWLQECWWSGGTNCCKGDVAATAAAGGATNGTVAAATSCHSTKGDVDVIAGC